MIKSLEMLLDDLESLYTSALLHNQLIVAVRIKELQIKYSLSQRSPYRLEDFTDEDLHTLYLTLNSTTHESSNDTLLEEEN